MKEKIQLKETARLNKLLASHSNKLVNSVIIILCIIIISLGYSLSKKILSGSSSEVERIYTQKGSPVIQVEVLNGCGIGGVGDKFTDIIRSKGIDVVKTGNYMSFDIDQTFIIDRSGKLETAYKVADSLGVDKKNIINQTNKQYFLDLTIVIGKDFNKYFQKSRS